MTDLPEPAFTLRTGTCHEHYAKLRNEHHGLTRREWLVCKLIAEGKTRSEIRTEMGITRKCVNKHIDHALGKLHIATDAEIVHFMISVGDVELFDPRKR